MIQLTIVTPERSLLNEQVDELQMPGADGYLGVLPGHAPLFTELKVGELSYRKGNTWTSLAVAWGFAEVLPDQVRVLAETAERAQEIDLERATRAKERAEQRLSKGGDDVDYDRALIALQRALIRIQVAQKRPVGILRTPELPSRHTPNPWLAKLDGWPLKKTPFRPNAPTVTCRPSDAVSRHHVCFFKRSCSPVPT